VAGRIPQQLFTYGHLAYSTASVLFYGQCNILSQEGHQQGNPLGPLLFCNSIHPLLASLCSVLKLGYTDDVTVGGPQETVAKKNIKLIMNAGQDIGPNLNTAKRELVCNQGCHITDPIFWGLRQVPASETKLLGVPLFPGTALDSACSKRCDELARAVDRLDLIWWSTRLCVCYGDSAFRAGVGPTNDNRL